MFEIRTVCFRERDFSLGINNAMPGNFKAGRCSTKRVADPTRLAEEPADGGDIAVRRYFSPWDCFDRVPDKFIGFRCTRCSQHNRAPANPAKVRWPYL